MAWRYALDEIARAIDAPPAGVDRHVQSVSTDTRTLRPGDLFFALRGEHFDGDRFAADAFARGAVAAVTHSPHDGGPCLIVKDALAALQQFATYHRRRCAIPVIALTGSCGKTSTKDLIASLLATRYRVVKTLGNLNNEIGCPLSVLRIDGETDCAVIEMGANHSGEIARLCEIALPTEAAITLIAPAHLEGFGTIEKVAHAKAEILGASPPPKVFYANADDPFCMQIAQAFPGEKVLFGQRGDVALESFTWEAPGEARLHVRPIGDLLLPLGCRAHAQNVLLAIAVGLRHGIVDFEAPLRAACATATRFKRLQIGPLDVIDDTYNANPASMAASLSALKEWPREGARIAALGDMFELGEAAAPLHREVGEAAARAGVTHLFAAGGHAHDMIAAAQAAGAPHAEVLDSHQAIADAIHAVASPGDLLLVKGSRGMRMERVIQALQDKYAPETPCDSPHSPGREAPLNP